MGPLPRRFVNTINIQGSGKTSFVNVLEIGGEWTEEVVPTVAFSFRVVRRDKIKLKIWDVAAEIQVIMGKILQGQ